MNAPGAAVQTGGMLADDGAARLAALTDLEHSILLGAGAGSGKTSVLAGRVVSMFVAGEAPASIAAISFTELSASELRERIEHYASELLHDRVPRPLRTAFPTGLTEAQKESLRVAWANLDTLVCTTIHGFCRTILIPYPVEARIDPGATMLDQAQSDLLLEEVRDRFLRKRLSVAAADDPFASLWIGKAKDVASLFDDLVACKLRHRRARVAARPQPFGQAEVTALTTALDELTAFAARELPAHWTPGPVKDTLAVLAAFRHTLTPPAGDEAALLGWGLSLRPPDGCATREGQLYGDSKLGNTKGNWEGEAKTAGAPKAEAGRLWRETSAALRAVGAAFAAVPAAAAARSLHLLADVAEARILDYHEAKTAAAALDFGDLLEKAGRLLERHEPVRRALAGRYRRILVDEFQDTDWDQAEVLWRLCGEPPSGDTGASWKDWTIRPGALFVVGDPQQSIYRFRGADLAVFAWAREALSGHANAMVLTIDKNFRSRESVIEWVNSRFEAALGREGQCGFTPLDPTVPDAPLTTPGVAAIDFPGGASADEVRDEEAERVADLCLALIGNLDVRDEGSEGVRKCRPGDIALLVPASTGLWRYERALEARNLAVAAQAGKGFYRRQEIQDIIALTRAIADERDRLALGAFLRGPLVGLTDQQLLDAVNGAYAMASASGANDGPPPSLGLRMELAVDADPMLRSRLAILRDLADRKRTTTPHLLLCQAVETLGVRATLRMRGGRVAERALANLDLFLELSRPYDVRGLKAFSDAMRKRWEDSEKELDGRPDADANAITLITMHSSKGLEWPVVIPVNCYGAPQSRTDVVHDGERGELHASVFGVRTEEGEEAFEREKEFTKSERQRLWYVGTTRARDLLVMPRTTNLPPKSGKGWMSLVEFDLAPLPPFGEDLTPVAIPTPEPEENGQDLEVWYAQQDTINLGTPRVVRIVPHVDDEDTTAAPPAPVVIDLDQPPVDFEVRGGLRRGLILHKLMEEALTGETAEDAAALAERCAQLSLELEGTPGEAPDPVQTAATVLATLALPKIAEVRASLVPEWTVASATTDAEAGELLVMGVADAVVPGFSSPPFLVVDWKSDVDPTPATVRRYMGQLGAYLRATGAVDGLLVFMTTGTTVPVSAGSAEDSEEKTVAA